MPEHGHYSLFLPFLWWMPLCCKPHWLRNSFQVNFSLFWWDLPLEGNSSYHSPRSTCPCPLIYVFLVSFLSFIHRVHTKCFVKKCLWRLTDFHFFLPLPWPLSSPFSPTLTCIHFSVKNMVSWEEVLHTVCERKVELVKGNITSAHGQ